MAGTIDFELPKNEDTQLITGAIFSEATAGANANADEKRCIALSILNMTYYATYTQPHKTCYNTDFGDGSVLDAIKKAISGYNSAMWKKVMESDKLKSKTNLEQTLIPSEIAHLKGAVATAGDVIDANLPANDTLTSRAPVQFNRAANTPPNPKRQEKIAHYGSHTFYAFKAGRECD